MAKIYLPMEVNSNQCAVLVSDGHVRIYDRIPNGTTQNNVRYWDFYIRDHYLESNDSTNFSPYTSLNCLNNNQFTTDFWYRDDIWQSLLCYFIIAIVGLYLPYKIFSRFFGRWLKV